jgi:hypothetical protein
MPVAFRAGGRADQQPGPWYARRPLLHGAAPVPLDGRQVAPELQAPGLLQGRQGSGTGGGLHQGVPVAAATGPAPGTAEGIKGKPAHGGRAAGGNHLGPEQGSQPGSQGFPTAGMPPQQWNGVPPGRIQHHHRGIALFVLQEWGDQANNQPAGPNRHHRFGLVPVLPQPVRRRWR